jgi:hypothetical protein
VDGYVTESDIKKYPENFFPYMVFLSTCVKKPFQLVPQFRLQMRSITIGKEQLAEIMVHITQSTTGKWDEMVHGLSFGLSDVPTRARVLGQQVRRKEAKVVQQEDVLEVARKRLRETEDELESLNALSTVVTKVRKLEHSLMTSRKRVTNAIVAVARKSKELIEKQRLHEVAERNTRTKSPLNLAAVSREKWLEMHHILAKHFFHPPPTVKVGWTGVLTTNGVSCSWQVVKRREWCTKKKRDEPPRPVSVDTLRPVDPTTRPRDYGTHGHDCLIVPTDEPLTVIAVDPGHDIRQHVPGQDIPIVVNGMQRERTKAWRRQ